MTHHQELLALAIPPASADRATTYKYGLALTVLSVVFFMWGFATVLNDILVPHLKAVFELNYGQSLLIQPSRVAHSRHCRG